jgi:hypothetical protein
MTATAYQSPEDFFNADGSYNVAAIMALAHAKARLQSNRALAIDAVAALGLTGWNGCTWSPRGKRYGNWAAEDAAYIATLAPELVATVKAARTFPRYADLLASALSDYWRAARVWKARGYADKARVRAAADLTASFKIAA